MRGRRQAYRRIHVETKPKGPQILVVLLALLAVVALTLHFFGPKLRSDAVAVSDVSPPDAAEARRYTTLDPDLFRPEVEALEEALFETPAAASGEMALVGEDIANAATPLRAKLRDAQGERAAAAVIDLEQLAESARTDEISLDRLGDLRDRWIRIRRNTFDSAFWFEENAAKGEDSADRAKLAVYQGVVRDLQDLVETALYEAEGISDEEAAGDRSEAGERRERWRDSVRAFRDDLTGLRERMPGRPSAGASQELLQAVHSLESALDSSKRLFSSISSMPRQPVNRRPYMDALEKIQQATIAFEDLAYAS